MIGDADHGIRDVVVALGIEVGVSEVRSLHDDAAILCSNVEAWAELIGDTTAVQGTDVRGALGSEARGVGVIQAGKEEATHACLEKGIPAAEGQVVDVRSGELLHARMDVVIEHAGDEVGVVLRPLVVHLERAARRDQVPVAGAVLAATFE